ncbi:MAG: DUF2231 domain-containing protein [Nocardioides sp.]
MEIGGMPLHPLVVHATVVLTPLAALLVVVFAVRERWRWLTRWPAGLTALGAAVAVLAARVTGKAFLAVRPDLAQLPLVHTHQQRAGILTWVTLAFTVVTLVGVLTLGGPSALASGRGAREGRSAALARTMPVLLVLAAVAELVWVVLTGDAGARAVWG